MSYLESLAPRVNEVLLYMLAIELTLALARYAFVMGYVVEFNLTLKLKPI